MATDRLGELLRRADAEVARPAPLPTDLPARLVRIAERRRRRRVMFMGAAAAVVLATVTALPLRWNDVGSSAGRRGSTGNASARRTATADREREIARLQAEADLHLAVARRLIALREREQRLAELAPVTRQVDPVRQAAAQADRAAIVLIQQGDHLCHDLRLPHAAAESYRCVLRAYAGTPWASIARQRLDEIADCQGESL